MWMTERFKAIASDEIAKNPSILPPLLRSLGRDLSPNWNPTVNKMTYLVLESLQSSVGDSLFESSCDTAFAPFADARAGEKIPENARSSADESMDTEKDATISKTKIKIGGKGGGGGGAAFEAQGSSSMSVKKQMESWKNSTARGIQPPSTVTGVAPWSMAGRSFGAAGSQPPSTITGVAPWAFSANRKGGAPRPGVKKFAAVRPSKVSRTEEEKMFGSSKHCDAAQEEEKGTSSSYRPNSPAPTVLMLLKRFMEKIRPAQVSKFSSWALTQLSDTPTLLPNLKFHDLVFGQELGTGAFSTVKYARHIKKSTGRSNWEEFAVKIVSIKTIRENGYERSVNREISVLRHLSHPGIARLVSSFRFRDGAYLVLEYASGGDLHMLVTNNGSLDDDSAKFVCGEVRNAAANRYLF